MTSLFRNGLVSISFRNWSPEEIIDALEPLPMEGIEWGGDSHVPHGDIKTAMRIGKLTREAGLEPFSYGSYYRFREVDPSAGEPDPAIDAVLDTAEALGSRRIRVWAGEMDFEEANASYQQAIAERAREVAELASKRGLVIDLEFHGGTLNNSALNSLKLLAQIDHTNVRTLWQPVMDLPLKDRLDGLKLLLPHISNLHCFHWGPGGFHDRRQLAEGMADWRAYLEGLQESGQPRWISLEFVRGDSLDSLEKDSRTLAELTGGDFRYA
ncbi:MAG: sugar phosphate isomerase/epimerase family protein [Puniceicoccaceae bacterium]